MNSYDHFLNDIAKNQKTNIHLLTQWANVNSSSHNLEGLSNILDALYSAFSSLPANIEKLSLSDNPSIPKALHLTCRPEAPLQVFLNGHMDTVYGIDHPFQKCTQIDDDTLKGPGVTDMKGGLIIMLEVLKALEASPWAKNIGWEVLIVPDEEIGSPHSTPLLEKAAKHHNLALAFEPCLPNGALARSRKGSGIFTITAHGKAAHAGRNFASGNNAIVGLSKFLLKFHAFNDQFPGATFNVGHIEGGGPINVVPDLATAIANIRVSTPEEKSQVLKQFNALVAEFNSNNPTQIELTGHFTRPPKPPSEAADYLYKELQACGGPLGLTLGWEDTGGAADGNILADSGLPNIDNLGVLGDNIHSGDEFITLDSLTQRSQLSTLFLLKLASGEITLPKTLFPNLS